MNKVFMIGNLTREPELTETSGGIKVCRFSIAVNRSYAGGNGERKTDFFNVIAWRGLAETAAKYLKKGNKVAVSGSIELRDYEDRQGVKQKAIDIVAQELEFLTPRESNPAPESDYVAPPRQQSMHDSRPALQPFDDDSDIPF